MDSHKDQLARRRGMQSGHGGGGGGGAGDRGGSGRNSVRSSGGSSRAHVTSRGNRNRGDDDDDDDDDCHACDDMDNTSIRLQHANSFNIQQSVGNNNEYYVDDDADDVEDGSGANDDDGRAPLLAKQRGHIQQDIYVVEEPTSPSSSTDRTAGGGAQTEVDKLLDAVGLTRSQRKTSLIVLGLFWFFSGVEYAVILPTIWKFLQALGMDHRWFLGLTISGISIASMISSPVFGLFADAGGTKKLLLAAGVFMVCGNFVYMIANDAYCVLESRFLCGLGNGVAAASFAYLARVSTREERTSVIGTVIMCRQLGILVGPGLNFAFEGLRFHLGPFLVDSLSAPGAIMTVLWTVSLLISAFGFHDIQRLPPGERGTDAGSGAEDRVVGGEESLAVGMTRVQEYTQLHVVVLFLVQFLCIFNQVGLETWVTPFTQQYFGWSETNNSIMYIVVGAVAIVSFVLVRVLTSSFGVTDRWIIGAGIGFEFTGYVWGGGIWFVCLFVCLLVCLPFLFIPAPAILSKLTRTMTVLGTSKPYPLY
ncbi:hypothetical protein PTSG_07349 [Salpingoeca rosetta]|uniref:Major facilitator superfamily (MFS) profile domain-containing protein n=1 Tax=Salpingoeca rosetta (strain ATCC 50818 / BSB-021) TaxID=946362 RepID=F2UJ58_SALR5|nr:uncharacterized protein PTSG_07349 [Salpingoeca rosetta]EGD77006.1 hypothetical protein PTSG_07349 [Salpingoeca rosetta]|eukprot:XP_004990846.1 hypothetical protein PTSG_07349 [Salpingoeca rosetta]